MVTFGDGALERPNIHELMPPSLDYFGFNCYLTAGCTVEMIQTKLHRSFAVRFPYQKLIFTLDAYWGGPPNNAIDERLVQRLTNWKAMLHPYRAEIAGLIPFLYTTFTPKNLYGTESLPKTREFLGAYMKEFRGITE